MEEVEVDIVDFQEVYDVVGPSCRSLSVSWQQDVFVSLAPLMDLLYIYDGIKKLQMYFFGSVSANMDYSELKRLGATGVESLQCHGLRFDRFLDDIVSILGDNHMLLHLEWDDITDDVDHVAQILRRSKSIESIGSDVRVTYEDYLYGDPKELAQAILCNPSLKMDGLKLQDVSNGSHWGAAINSALATRREHCLQVFRVTMAACAALRRQLPRDIVSKIAKEVNKTARITYHRSRA